jgi:hypothetical protein
MISAIEISYFPLGKGETNVLVPHRKKCVLSVIANQKLCNI